MIVQLTGTLVEVTPSRVTLDVGGVGYELGVSSTTAAALPHTGEAGVTILTRLIVREDAMELFGFSSRSERALFDQLRAISGVGPKLALAVLSTFTPSQLAQVVATQDASRMAQVPGVGRKKASRLLVELSDVFNKNADLRELVGLFSPESDQAPLPVAAMGSVESEAAEALLSMGFTSQEAELALEGHEEAGALTIEKALAYALRRLGGGRLCGRQARMISLLTPAPAPLRVQASHGAPPPAATSPASLPPRTWTRTARSGRRRLTSTAARSASAPTCACS